MFAFCIVMRGYEFSFCGIRLAALPSGALWWPGERLLCVSDLHLGKSERLARRGGILLPPYDTRETLKRLKRDVEACAPGTVVCLGDNFDDQAAAAALPDDEKGALRAIMEGRRWVWLAGNHDPGAAPLAGQHAAEFPVNGLTFRHIARNERQTGEVSGHFHPKVRVPTRARALSRPCFLLDRERLILPAYGTYTGGLWADNAALRRLVDASGIAILTGRQALAVPLSRCA